MSPCRRRAAALAVALAAAGCTGKEGKPGPTGPAASTQGTIFGLVTDGNVPLAGAAIAVDPGGFVAQARADGSYSVDVPLGVYVVVATQAGFQPQAQTGVSVIAGSRVEIDLILSKEPGPLVKASAGPDRFQAGFGTQVQLDARASTGPTGETLAYLWFQTAGPPVTLTGDDTATPTFTTRTLAELEQDGRYPIRRSAGLLGFTEADLAALTYEFRVAVVGEVSTDFDTVRVRPVINQVGFPVVAKDTLAVLSAGTQATYAWTCSLQDPGGPVPCAAGVLTGATLRNPTFRANVAGTYLLQTPGEPAVEVRAATYIGARAVGGQVTCTNCHAARVDSWEGTKHASYLRRALGGELRTPAGELVFPGTGPADYRAECIRCHTTGYNPEADAGGFAQVAAATLWVFAPGGYDAMQPTLQTLAAVGCENCHGPGSLHAAGRSKVTIGKSLAAVACAQCHATEPYENQGLQWVNARHSQFVTGFRPDAGDPALQGTCSSCHSSPGFIAWTDSGVNTAPPAAADVTEPQTCQACHDPHGEALTPAGQPTPRQLRVYGDVTTLVPGLGARGVGPGALCLTCHNSRTGVARATEVTLQGAATQAAPHGSSQGDVLLGKNAATLGGPPYPSSAHAAVPKLCVGCHMAPTPPLGAPGHNLVGGHSVALRNGAITHLAACTGCHAGLETFDRTAYGDYDGNGFLEGIQTEVDGLLGKVQEQLDLKAAALWPAQAGATATVVNFNGRIRILKQYQPGVSPAACDPASGGGWTDPDCFAFPAGAIPQTSAAEADFLQAAWNFLLVERDRSRGVHNAAFAVSALQRSYQALAGQPVPGANVP